MPAHKRFFLTSVFVVLALGAWTATSDAQIRGRGPVRRVVVVGAYYDPFFYDPWYGFGYQYPWGLYPPYRYYNTDPGASVRLEVKPREAEVYVDGYYAGIVDDFDGTFQRLRVSPGEHDIELYLDGYRTVRQHVYLTPDNTFKVKYAMERLAAGEQPEPRPQPANPPMPPAGGQPAMQGPPPMPGPPGRGPMGRRMPPPQQPPQLPPPDNPQVQQGSAYGTLAIRVQPADAEVLIDGETWRGPDTHDRLVVEVAEGRHTIEIRKAGYRTYVTDVQVRSGETMPLNVSLRNQDER